ncbi:P-loop containing nucleoside triphosphate hydrolase protein, partial [Hypoxylon rubiginosum]
MEYIKTLRDLQALGMSHVADLPEVVLVNDWSSSQSSLLFDSALPQSAGVRKCCPFHIHLGDNANWSCTISFQRKYDFPTFLSRQPIGWPFKTIFNRSEMNEVLRWAQVANLNPGRNHELFIPGEGAIAKEVPFDVVARGTDAQFSPNVITLEIKGPGLPDLSFYDLPSVSTLPEKKDEQAAEAIKSLVMEYIKREKALVIWALPIHVPLENSASWDIIRKSGAIDRTIGILTKADQFSPQDIPACLAMFRKEGQEVGHGFFAISRPSKQLNEAISWEELLFPLGAGDLAAWPNELAEFKRRCGTRALLDYLLSQIGQVFVRSLPSIKTMVGAGITSVQSDLATLPGLPVANAEHDAKKSLVQALQQMKTAIDTEFSPRWNTLNEQFWACLFTMKPICKLKGSDTPVINTFNVDSDITTLRSRLDDPTVQNEDIMPRPIEQDIPIDSTPQASSTTSPFSNFGCGTIDIEKIRNEIIRHSRPGMVQHAMPDEVLETLCLDEIKKWKLPLETYISKTTELLKKTASAVLEASLGEFRY